MRFVDLLDLVIIVIFVIGIGFSIFVNGDWIVAQALAIIGLFYSFAAAPKLKA